MRCWIHILLLGSTFCSGQIATGVRVNEVRFDTDKSISAPILDHCAKLINRQYFEGPDWREKATERLVFCLQDNGYFKATVNPQFQQLADKDNTHQFAVTFRLNPGHQFRIADIILSGSKPFDPSEIKSLLNVHPGEIFARNKIATGLDNLRRFCGQKGYIDFTPVPLVEADDVRSTIVLRLSLDPGRQYHVGGIAFSGVSSETAAKLISNLELKKGAVFEEDKVSEFFQQNKGILPKTATQESNFSVIRDDASALVYLKFDFMKADYSRK
jgi:outer membrane translocation and assembly module TamA